MREWFKKLRDRAPQVQSAAQRTCALCDAALDAPVTAEKGTDGDLPRYDLCRRCETQLFAQWGLPFQEYLDALEMPVVVTDGNEVVRAANRAACMLLGKEAGQMEGRLRGLVFDCEHALAPEGCGRTVHCSGCVIRNTVTDCYLTGRSHLRIPATLDRGIPGDETTERLLVSTVRRDNMVLLKIEWDSAAAE